jgi:hypothetical protein
VKQTRGSSLAALWLLAWLVLLLSTPAFSSDRKLIIGVIDQVTWGDLLSRDVHAPTLRALAKGGGVGMMSVRAARSAGGDGAYLTIGAGARAAAAGRAGQPSPEGRAFDVAELVDGQPAGRVYTSRTGWPIGDNRIVHPGIGELIRQNESLSYPITPGMLGGTLRRAGLRVACVGNADTQDRLHRELVAIGMDEQGLVELGEVGSELLSPAPNLAYRVTTDPKRLLWAFHHVAAAADVIAIDFGETSRVGEYAVVMPPLAARKARARAIAEADRLLAAVVRVLPKSDWGVLILAPTARDADPEERSSYLTPVIFRGPRGTRGLLTSPSTRRKGLVVNTDVAATVLDYFEMQTPAGVVGRPMRVEQSKEDSLSRMKSEEARQGDLEVARRYAFRWLAVLSAVALWASTGMFALGDRVPRWLRSLARGLLLILLAAPPALLLVGLRPLSLPQVLGGAVALAAIIALVGAALTSWRSGHALPAIALVALLIWDLVRGQNMLQWSPLSYSAASGARFYGIGNEYGGALLGAALIGIAAVLSRRQHASSASERFVAAVVLFGITGLVGYPRYGANLGMALGCAVGFAVFLAYLWQERPTWANVLTVLIVMGVAAGAAVGADAFLRGGGASHVGMFLANVKQQGWNALIQVAARKWTMNWALVRASLWTDTAVAGFGVLGALLLAKPRRALTALAEEEWLGPAVIACAAGAVASWAFNDSGIVAAALVMLYGAGTMAYLGLGDA